MKKMKNETHIEGLLYQHSLEIKTAGENSKNPGTQYITGNIEIATDAMLLNIIPIHFTYVTEKTATGKANSAYPILMDIINNVNKNVMEHGADNATKFRVDSAVGLNEFYTEREGAEIFVSSKRNEGGFIHKVSELNPEEGKRDTFETDIVIYNVTVKEADPEKELPEKGIVKGYIFNFRNDVMPVEYVVFNPNAIAYFESLEPSTKNPVFTKVWGHQVSKTIMKKVVTESAFGEDSVKEVPNNRKEFVITGASKDIYDWDSEGTILASEFSKALSEREIYLATQKQRRNEYLATKNSAIVSDGDFKF